MMSGGSPEDYATAVIESGPRRRPGHVLDLGVAAQTAVALGEVLPNDETHETLGGDDE